MPITWRSVAAPDFTPAGQLLNLSNNLIDRGANQISDVMNARLQTQKQEWDATKEQNTQDALNNIRGMDSAQLNQANIAGLLSPYGAQINQQAVRDAFNNQDEFIAGNLQTAQNIKDSTDRTKYGAVNDTFLQALAQGDMTKAQELVKQLQGTVYGVDAANAYTTRANTLFDQNIANRRLAMEGQANALAAQRFALDKSDHDLRVQQANDARSWADKGQQIYADAIKSGKDPEAILQAAELNVPAQYLPYFKQGAQGIASVTQLTGQEKADLQDTVLTPISDKLNSFKTEFNTKKDNALKNSGLNQDEIKAYEQQGVSLDKIVGDGKNQIPKDLYDGLVKLAASKGDPGISTNELNAVKYRYEDGESWTKFQDNPDDLYKKIQQMRAGYDYYNSEINSLNAEYNTQTTALERQVQQHQRQLQQSKLMNVDPKVRDDKIGEVRATIINNANSLSLHDVPVFKADAQEQELTNAKDKAQKLEVALARAKGQQVPIPTSTTNNGNQMFTDAGGYNNFNVLNARVNGPTNDLNNLIAQRDAAVAYLKQGTSGKYRWSDKEIARREQNIRTLNNQIKQAQAKLNMNN